MDIKETWENVLNELKVTLSKANFLTWFKDTALVDIKENTAFIKVPSSFVKEWLEEKYNKTLLKILNKLNPEIEKIQYLVSGSSLKIEQIKKTKNDLLNNPAFQIEQMNLIDTGIDPETNLNPKYTFENFVVGSNNELAHAAALAVTENLGKKYNPLFIYGGVGLGKTHLLQAIGNKLKKEKKKLKIQYVSCEKFTEELVNSIRKQTIDEFRKKFRQLDLLLIDDVQFVTGKDKTQEELFYTFNTLYEKNKQIVFTSDRPPKAIPSIEERLRSRFEGGMIADIGYPDFETRLAILKTKNQMSGGIVNEEILRYIANNVSKNVRELEGALNRIIAEIHLRKRELTLEEAKKILSSILNKNSIYITPQEVIKKVAAFYDLDEKQILSHSRKKELVKPRQVIMYLLREELRYSFTNIAEKLGHRDHTTVIYACEKISKEIENNPIFSQEITLLKDLLYNK